MQAQASDAIFRAKCALWFLLFEKRLTDAPWLLLHCHSELPRRLPA